MSGFTPAVLLKRYAATEEHDRRLLKRLNISESELTPHSIAKQWRACAQDEDFFVFNYCRTRDEHEEDGGSIREFEADPVVAELLYTIRTKPIVLVSKTRQIRATWTLSCHMVWRAKFQRNRLVFFQSKREKDAHNVVFYKDWTNARCSFVELHLPWWMRTEEAEGVSGQLFYPTGSRIWGIPQGPHMLRSYTATEVVMDECAFWDAFRLSYQAALPMVKGGGNIVAITTPNPGSYFAELIGETDDAAVMA